MPTPELLANLGDLNQSLIKAGILLAAEGPEAKPARQATTFLGQELTVSDEPFAATKELIADF